MTDPAKEPDPEFAGWLRCNAIAMGLDVPFSLKTANLNNPAILAAIIEAQRRSIEVLSRQGVELDRMHAVAIRTLRSRGCTKEETFALALPDPDRDDASRRPSHADRRKALQREMLEGDFQRCWGRWPLPQKIRHLLDRVLRLVA